MCPGDQDSTGTDATILFLSPPRNADVVAANDALVDRQSPVLHFTESSHTTVAGGTIGSIAGRLPEGESAS